MWPSKRNFQTLRDLANETEIDPRALWLAQHWVLRIDNLQDFKERRIGNLGNSRLNNKSRFVPPKLARIFTLFIVVLHRTFAAFAVVVSD